MPTNINRDYVVTIDVKSGSITTPNMTFFNTDKKTSNIYVKLVVRETIASLVTIENASDFTVKINIIKPNNQVKILDGKLLDKENALFEFDLPSECTNLSGICKLEFTVCATVNENKECITTDETSYTVKKSILTDLDPSIEDSSDYPILLDLIEEVKKLQENAGTGVNLFSYQKKNDSNLDTVSKEIVGGINENTSQIKQIAKDLVIENNKLYLKKEDGTKIGLGVTLPTSTGTSGKDGVGITSITKTNTVGLVDTYTITFTDKTTTTFNVTNGSKGDKGDKGIPGTNGINGKDGKDGAKGEPGSNGKDGLTTSVVVNGNTYNHNNGVITLPNYPTLQNDTLVTINIVDKKLILTTDKYQTTSVANGTEIILPNVNKFTEIHLFFNASSDMTLTLPSCKWQSTPSFTGGKTYELIFTYVGEWIAGVICYE